jgi:hypothetical protein
MCISSTLLKSALIFKSLAPRCLAVYYKSPDAHSIRLYHTDNGRWQVSLVWLGFRVPAMHLILKSETFNSCSSIFSPFKIRLLTKDFGNFFLFNSTKIMRRNLKSIQSYSILEYTKLLFDEPQSVSKPEVIRRSPRFATAMIDCEI